MALYLDTPSWLAGLLLIPLVWWLHRFRELGRSVPVAAAFLWVTGAASADSGRLARVADPAWLLRALLLSSLLLALAGPHWQLVQAPPVTVWLDDSRSMFATESGATRMQSALAELEQALARSSYGPVTLRSLGSPGLVRQLTAAGTFESVADFAGEPRGEPTPPAPTTMNAGQLHWLVSDGASAGLASWAARAPLSRIFQPGGEAR